MKIVETITAGMSLALIYTVRLLGVAFVVNVTLGNLTKLVTALQGHRRRITAYRFGNRWHMTVENATKADLQTAMEAGTEESCDQEEENGQNGAK